MRLRILFALFILSGLLLLFLSLPNETNEKYSEITFDDLTAPSYRDSQRPLSGAELKADAQVEELTTKANMVLSNIRQVCDDFHLEYAGIKEFVATQGTISSTGAYLKSPEADFRFWLPSQQVTSWNNDTLELALIIGANSNTHHLATGEHWTQDKAFEIGTAFLHALLDGTDVRLRQGDAHFIPQQSKNGSGQWLLTWNRVDSRGYQFYNIEFKVQLPEGYCPVSAQVPEITPYTEQKGILISHAEALAIARKGHSAVTSESSSPEIIGKDLVWTFWDDPPGDPQGSGPVYIDAYTGESKPVPHY